MAGQADGSIIVDTEIDASGFKADSAELQKAIKSLNSKVESLGPTFQKAMSGNESAVSNFDARAAALEDTIAKIESKMDSLGQKTVPTEQYQQLTAELEKAKVKLDSLEAKQAKMQALGVKETSQAWKSLQYDIEQAAGLVDLYERDLEKLQNSGNAFQMGVDTSEYEKLKNALDEATSELERMRSAASGTGKETSKLGAIAGTVGKALAAVGKTGVKGFKAVFNGIKGAIGKMREFTKSSKGASGGIGGIVKKITGLGSMLKRMAIRKILNGIIKAVKEGFDNLAQYSSQTNADMSALKSGLTQLKNSFATAFAPILTAIVPILTKLIGYLSTALTQVGKFVAAVTGAKTFTRAKAVQEDYAASLKGTSKAAKDTQKQLAGFDSLNVLSDSSKDSDSGSTDPSEMFEEVPIESNITDLADRLENAFLDGNFGEIGNFIGSTINKGIQKINDFIKWDKIEKKITKGISGIADGFNSLVKTVDFENIGDTLAQGLNSIVNIIDLIFTKFDWPGLAAQLANGLNGLLHGFDWNKLGQTISTGLRTALATLRSAIVTFDWAGLGKAAADLINGIDWVGIFSDLAGLLSDALIACLDLCLGLVYNLDWEKLGSDLWDSVVGILENIDWGGIISKAFELLGAALAGALKLIIGFAKKLWESLKQAFEDTKEYFAKYIDEAGGNVIEGLLNGIWDAIKNIGAWIKEHIFQPFIDGFKKVFGIHSPSTVMAEMGGYLIDGLLGGITDVWNKITDFFGGALDGIKDLCSSAWDGIKSAASTAWDGISGVVSGAWDGIKNGVSSACSAVSEGVSSAWENVKSWTSEKWENVKSTVSGTWENIKSVASDGWNAVKTGISDAWGSVKSWTSEKWNNIKSTLSDTWNNIKSKASSIWGSVKESISGAWENLKSKASSVWDGIKGTITGTWDKLKESAPTWGKDLCSNMANGIKNAAEKVGDAVSGVASKIKSFLGFSEPEDGPLSNFHTYMPDMIDLMTVGIKKNQGTAIAAIGDMASAISNEIQNGDYALGSIKVDRGLNGSLENFSDKIIDGFSNLLERLQSIANGVTFSTPSVAKGIAPYSVAASSNGGDSVTNAIETSNDELASVVTQAVTNATSAIVNAIQSHGGTTVNLDAYSLAGSVINEINRRTRMNGKSPLIG